MVISKKTLRRERYLKEISKDSSNIAILSHKGLGKTTLLKQFISSSNGITIYLNLETTALSPEMFAIELVSAACSEMLKKHIEPDLESLVQLKLDKELRDHIKTIKNELLKIRPDQRLVVASAFSFIEAIAEKQKLTVCFDNVEQLFSLDKFDQIKDIGALAGFSSAKTRFVVAGSAITFLSSKLSRFRLIELEPFTLQEVKQLAARHSQADSLYSISKGNPSVIAALAEVIDNYSDAQEAYIEELTHKNTTLNSYAYCAINYYLNRARGKTLLYAILKALALNSPMRLSEISRKIYRSAPITKSLLERLMLVDIITKTDSKFAIAMPVIKHFIIASHLKYKLKVGLDEQ